MNSRIASLRPLLPERDGKEKSRSVSLAFHYDGNAARNHMKKMLDLVMCDAFSIYFQEVIT